MHIPKAKLPFYPLYEVKCRLQNGVSTGDGWETLSDDFWGDVPRLLCRWETLLLSVFALQEMLPFPSFFFFNPGHYSDPCVLPFTVKERPDLESKFDEQVQAAVKYARTIEDFNELIDPRTLARHCLGPEPSLYVLSALDREEKKRKLPWHPGRISFQLFLPLFF